MMKNPRFEEEKIIKDVRNLFSLKEKMNYIANQNKINLFRREIESKEIKDRILSDIKNKTK